MQPAAAPHSAGVQPMLHTGHRRTHTVRPNTSHRRQRTQCCPPPCTPALQDSSSIPAAQSARYPGHPSALSPATPLKACAGHRSIRRDRYSAHNPAA
ncbi:hypothetical protein GDO78_001630 [Eleutherodactylus coqui]|uniref:Uncharacterized protein n=1 Tax=Eleutherodactylus coqui TaxID=57060 RepID=A0A8J6FWC8_ELECQ|nr:hypothetical protein GDO78_001630 [Eleutherodactylus coqui]